MNVKIPDWQYHVCMLSDIAKREGMAHVLVMHTLKEKQPNFAISFSGTGLQINTLICKALKNLGEQNNLPPLLIWEMIRNDLIELENNKEVKPND